MKCAYLTRDFFSGIGTSNYLLQPPVKNLQKDI